MHRTASYKRLAVTFWAASRYPEMPAARVTRKMKDLGNLFSLCMLVILAGSIHADSTRMDSSGGEDYRASPSKLKNARNNPECPLSERHMKGTGSEIGERTAEDFTRTSEAASFIDCIEDSRGEDDPRPGRQWETVMDPSSHDILLDPGLIPVRLVRRAARSDADYPQREDTSGDIDSSLQGSDSGQDDLGVAEDRHQSRYPYWYRGQSENQRYRMNDRREHYRNYLRYPVFPGR